MAPASTSIGTTWLFVLGRMYCGVGLVALCAGVWYDFNPSRLAHFFWRSVGPPLLGRCRLALRNSLYTVCLSRAFRFHMLSVVGAGTLWSRTSCSSEGCSPSWNIMTTPISVGLCLTLLIKQSKSAMYKLMSLPCIFRECNCWYVASFASWSVNVFLNTSSKSTHNWGSVIATPKVSHCSFNQDCFCLAQASTFGPLKYERHRATLRNGVVNCFESPLTSL